MEALREVAGLGPFFALASDTAGPEWRAFDELIAPDSLSERVDTACAFLAERFRVERIERRAVASMQFLGTVARLVSPTLATLVCHGVLPSLTGLRWRPSEGGRVEFALAPPDEVGADAGSYERFVLQGPVRRIEDAVRTEFRLSRHVTRGNVASALGGAATVLGSTRPEARDAADATVRRLLHSAYLAGSADWPEGHGFRRTNCCLFYRIPNAGKCGDCVLLPRET